MQNGDLSEYDQPTVVFVLEGVLCDVTEVEETTGRIRKHRSVSYDLDWYELPLKRIVVLKNAYPDVSIEVVTFTSEAVAERAANHLERIRIPVNGVSYESFKDWTFSLRFRPEIQTIYDSDLERIHFFGQRGYAVSKGTDFG